MGQGSGAFQVSQALSFDAGIPLPEGLKLFQKQGLDLLFRPALLGTGVRVPRLRRGVWRLLTPR